jgi:hypothetical protein
MAFWVFKPAGAVGFLPSESLEQTHNSARYKNVEDNNLIYVIIEDM